MNRKHHPSDDEDNINVEQDSTLMTEGFIQRPPPTSVYGRVKLKLKTTPKPSPDVQFQSVRTYKNDDVIEDRDNFGSVKVLSFKESASGDGGCGSGSGSRGGEFYQKLSPAGGGEESGGSVMFLEEKKVEEHESRRREAKYSKRQLDASLEVIKKIMKMDAAEPFNVPVDPIGLGIPDYFDVIDTPMDFGTIRNNLEGGNKYRDSEDVYKDVQLIWDNCYRYNSKGDYIVDLMKRVKKNFMKYWMAAGLYTEQTKTITGGESSPVDEPATSGIGKKLKKGKGVKRHKDDCLCAICIMKRRRQEREAREAQLAFEARGQTTSPHIKLLKTGLKEDYKQEFVRVESPVEETSSYMETSPDGDVDVEMEDGEMKLDASLPQYINEQKLEVDRAKLHDKFDRSGDITEKSVQRDTGDTELYSLSEAKVQDESGSKMNIDVQKQPSIQLEEQTVGYMQQRHELLELEKKRQKKRMLETFRDLENPMLLGLCGMLFPNKVQSIWNSTNSLIRSQRPCNRGDIHEAVASFMNPPCKSAYSRK